MRGRVVGVLLGLGACGEGPLLCGIGSDILTHIPTYLGSWVAGELAGYIVLGGAPVTPHTSHTQ